MSQRTVKIIYYTATSLLSALMLSSGVSYFLNHAAVAESFSTLGYPAHLVYPLAIAKLLGIVAIWTKLSNTLKEWAYAGFFFDFLIAFAAHFYAGDGEFVGALVVMLLLLVSYRFEKSLTAA